MLSQRNHWGRSKQPVRLPVVFRSLGPVNLDRMIFLLEVRLIRPLDTVGKAAIHHHGLAGHKRGAIAGEPAGHLGDIVRNAGSGDGLAFSNMGFTRSTRSSDLPTVLAASGVAIKPGQMALTRIKCSPSSIATDLLICITADLAPA